MFRHVFPKLSAKQQLVQGWNNPRFNSLLLGNVHQRAGFHQYQVKHAGSCFRGISSSVLPSRRFLASTPPTVSPMSENQERAEMRLRIAREYREKAELELTGAREELEVRKQKRVLLSRRGNLPKMKKKRKCSSRFTGVRKLHWLVLNKL